MKAQDTQRLAEACLSAAAAAAMPDGFVPMRQLIRHLDAELQARPLLFEGMLAAPRQPGTKWRVVIDNSRTGFRQETYDTESVSNALPARVRFTIAHELGHLMQLNGTEAMISEDQTDLIERQADTVTPLLLVSASDLARRLGSLDRRIALKDLIEARSAWGISNEVLVRRLALLHRIDPAGLRFRHALRDVAVGVGECDAHRVPRIASWPRPFVNFEDNIVPEFLLSEGQSSLRDSFELSDSSVRDGATISTTVDGGTPSNPKCEKLSVRLEIAPAANGRFLFLIERLRTD